MRRLTCPWVLVVLSSAPFSAPVSAQTVLGDPSSTLGSLGRFSVEVGGAVVASQGLRFDAAMVPMVLTSRTLTIDSPEYTSDMEGEQAFLTATVGLGSSVDAFGMLGSARIEGDGFRGARSVAGGGGLRISPPQTGPVRIGLRVQALRLTGADPSISVVIVDSDASPGDPDEVGVNATGDGREDVALTRYDALLGFGVHSLPYVRPYGGLLFTIANGSDEAVLTGQANYLSCPRGGGVCTPGGSTFSMSFDNGFESEKALGAVVGAVVDATARWGFTIEGRFLSQTAYGVAAHLRF